MLKDNNPWSSKPNIEPQQPAKSKSFQISWSSAVAALIIGLLIIRQLWEWFPIVGLMLKGIWK
jgi:hypothetical protein